MLKINIFIITLENRPDRKKEIENYYKKYLDNITFFYGETKDNIKKNKENITTYLCNKFCSIGMVGCASSHILLWKHISELKNNKLNLILEDDTFLDIDYLLKKIDIIEKLFKKYNNNIFLQLIGEGVYRTNTIDIDGEKFNTYYKHLFLGSYMISNVVAKSLFEYFYNTKISYHIDYSLNTCFSKKNILPLLINDDKLGEQRGKLDSNMRESNIEHSKCFNEEKYEILSYILNIPLFVLNNIIITFGLIFLFLLLIITILTKNIFIICLITIIGIEIIKFDY